MVKKKQINVTVSEEVYDKIVVMAEKEVRTLSNMGEILILQALGELDGEQQ